MSPRRAARAAVVCILFFGVTSTSAQPVIEPTVRRPVAVIDLGDTDANRTLAGLIGSELSRNEDLKPVDNPNLFSALSQRPLVDEEVELLNRARTEKQTAEDHVGGYRFPQATKSAEDGLRALQSITPTPTVLSLYAELAFILGVGRLGDNKPDKAADAFRLANAVSATFKPDQIRYVPEVVQAYATAIKAGATLAKGKIDVAGTGRVLVDGREVGTAPAWFDAPAGTHVVWLVDADRFPRAKPVTVIANQKERIEIEDAKVSLEDKVQRARLALKLAPDPAARATAMQQLAALVEVKDAVLLSTVNGKTVVQTWTEKAPGFSALREKKDEKAIDLLAPLLPPKKIVVIPPRPPKEVPKPLPDTRSWYEKPRYRIGAGTALVVGIIASLYAYSKWQDSRRIKNDMNPGFELRGP